MKTDEEIRQWVNSSEGHAAITEGIRRAEARIQERRARREEWLRELPDLMRQPMTR